MIHLSLTYSCLISHQPSSKSYSNVNRYPSQLSFGFPSHTALEVTRWNRGNPKLQNVRQLCRNFLVLLQLYPTFTLLHLQEVDIRCTQDHHWILGLRGTIMNYLEKLPIIVTPSNDTHRRRLRPKAPYGRHVLYLQVVVISLATICQR